MELVIVALIASFGSVIVALIQRASKLANNAGQTALVAADIAMKSAGFAHQKLDAIEKQTATNGSNSALGVLVEVIHSDTRETKNAVRRLERKVEKHQLLPSSLGHPTEEE